MKKTKSSDPFFDVFVSAPKAKRIYPVVKDKAKAKRVVKLGKDLDLITAFRVMDKVLKNERLELETRYKKTLVIEFSNDAFELKRKPDAFLGLGDLSQAAHEIRKKGSNIALTPEFIERLEKLGIPYEKNVRIPERYIVSPEIDQFDLARLAKLIKTDPVLKKKKLILKQPEEFINTVGDETIDEIAKKLPRKTIQGLMAEVATFATGKFSLEGKNIQDGNKKVTDHAKNLSIAFLQELAVLPKSVKD